MCDMDDALKVKVCRICGGALASVLDLGRQYLQSLLDSPGAIRSHRKVKLELAMCIGPCRALQLTHSYPRAIINGQYWYESGVTELMRGHLGELAADALRFVSGTSTSQKKRIIDIGCNDGTLLRQLHAHRGLAPSGSPPQELGRDILLEGWDPSDLAARHAPGAPYRFEPNEWPTRTCGSIADVIVSASVLYDTEDPVGFMEAIRHALRPGGTWVCEVSYWPILARNMAWDTICHEHIFQYQLYTIEWIMKQVGLELFGAQLNEMNGGSIRFYARRAHEPHAFPMDHESLYTLRLLEFNDRYECLATQRSWAAKAAGHREELCRFFERARSSGMHLHGLGASTKGNTIIQACQIDAAAMPYISDRNPRKRNMFVPHAGIKVISEEESRAKKPEAYFVFPWAFRDAIIQRECAASGSGNPRFIVPMPEIRS